jgi:ribonuclease HI
MKGSVAAIKRLTTVQRAGTIAITGALRTSPTDTLDAYANIIPAPLLVEKLCHKAAIRLATIPPEHPLYKPVKASANKYIRRHKAPLHNLMQISKIDPNKMEKISVAVRNPLDINKIPLRISIASDKEKSKTEAISAPETVKVYADGSEIQGKVGAAATLLRPGCAPRILHYHLGSKSKHTTSEAELVGLLLGLHLIKTEKKGNTSFALGTDDKEAIKTLTSDLTQTGQKIATETIKTISQIQRQRNSTRYSLTLRWTAGHTGIQGNDAADREAKKAARGTTSDKNLLPHLLKRGLTTNSTASRKSLNKTINEKWKTNWRNSPRGIKMRTIDDTTPSSTFLNLISGTKLTRKDSSVLTQICTGHIPLNSYLHKFKLVDSPNCPACGAAAETVHHFLFTCPTHAHARWPLKQKCKGTLTLKKIMADRKLVGALIGYINATERLKNTQSEFIRPIE